MPFVIASFSLLITVLNTIPLHYVPLRYNSWTYSLDISFVSVDQSVQGDKSKRILQLARSLSGHSVVVMARDGLTLAGVTDHSKITLWNLKTGTKIRTLAGHALPILSLAISPDGKLLASAGHDKTIKIWNLQTGEEIRSLNNPVLLSQFPSAQMDKPSPLAAGVTLSNSGISQQVRRFALSRKPVTL